ncbi:hypothetical protein CBER1_05050 [Cercospora berteroae]|uniref:Uncharacterized protein n=1 Tax=Cercospora berteroae TaxID=357750 RepID=A0A2S6BRI8_9PEZI|nr:hypothetical protein CBER1_05050 [Cercospora berteroae]
MSELSEESTAGTSSRDCSSIIQPALTHPDDVSADEEAMYSPASSVSCHLVPAKSYTDNDAGDDHPAPSPQLFDETKIATREALDACPTSASDADMGEDSTEMRTGQASIEATALVHGLKVKVLNLFYITGLRERGHIGRPSRRGRKRSISRDSYAHWARSIRNTGRTDGRSRSRRARSLPPYLSCAGHGRGQENYFFETNSKEPSGSANLPAHTNKRRERPSDDDDDQQRARQRARHDRHETNPKSKLPCIFYIGEPLAYPDHVRKYDHISLLLHVTTMADRPAICQCITTADQQWQELYKLQYPMHQAVTLHEALVSAEGTATEPLHLPMEHSLTPAQDAEEIDWQLSDSGANFARGLGEVAADGQDLQPPQEVHQLYANINGLQQQVLLLEQRVLSQPTAREEDLELTLGFVWQALCRSESVESQPETLIWRMISRHAPNVLSSASTISLPTVQPAVVLSANNLSTNYFSGINWDEVMAGGLWTDTLKRHAVDSGYGASGQQ